MPSEVVGIQGHKFPYSIKTTADHWWPKGIQRLWINEEGFVSRVSPSGTLKRDKPPSKGSKKKGFAQKRGGHRLQMGVSPWNHTFESDFGKIDSAGPEILRSIQTKIWDESFHAFNDLPPSSTEALTKLCFSLIVRSPSFRHRYAQAGKNFGLSYNELTGTVNILHFWNSAKRIDLKSCNGGRLVLFQSLSKEFCFSDGIVDTIFNKPITAILEKGKWKTDLVGDALIPLLPDICAHLYFDRDLEGFSSTICQVNSDYVEIVNSLTQVCAKEQLFFRAQAPQLTDDFRKGEHMEIDKASYPLLEHLRAIPT